MDRLNLGKRGFAAQVPSVAAPAIWAGTDMLYTDPRDPTPRRWTLSLNSMKFSGQGATALLPAPPDNQVDVQPQYRVRVEWTVEGAQEVAFVDWPSRGCTFSLHGGMVKCSVFAALPQITTILPILSAFLTPTERTVPLAIAPTLTSVGAGASVGTPIAPLSFASFPAPPRAAAYRWWAQGPLVANTVFLNQRTGATGAGLVVARDSVGPQNADAALATPEEFTGNRSAYYPLHPMAQQVVISNGDAVNTITVWVQFLLDLG